MTESFSGRGLSKRIAAGIAAIVFACTACGDAPRAGGQPRIVAALYPLGWLSEQVAGTHAEVTDLLEPGADAHDAELSARQISDIVGADLVVFISRLQPAVDSAVAEHAGSQGKALDAAALTTLLPGHDPHLWLDPTRLTKLATAVGERLAAVDPGNAAGYRARAVRTVATLSRLDEKYRNGLAVCARRTIITSHTAFGYLADRYQLRQVGISGIDPDSDPSPRRLAEVAKLAKREKVTTIFFERTGDTKVAEALAADVGATTAALDPVETRPADGGDYLSTMERNLDTLRTALGCR